MNLDFFDALWRDHQPEQSGQAAFWDKRAPSFNAHRSEGPDGHRRALVDKLAAKAGLGPQDEVLDIGCGSGQYSIMLAERVADVQGVDISPRMIEFARQNAVDARCPNAHFAVQDWENVRLNSQGWEKRFKLVLASKTPAVNNLATLEKMNAASSGLCCMLTQVHTENSIRDQLQSLTDWDEGKARASRPFYCAFNILWLLGYYPEVEYMERNWESELEPEEALNSYLNYFRSLGALRAGQEEAASAKLAALAKNGYVHERVRSKMALVFWEAGV